VSDSIITTVFSIFSSEATVEIPAKSQCKVNYFKEFFDIGSSYDGVLDGANVMGTYKSRLPGITYGKIESCEPV